MAGQIKQMLDQIIAARSQGDSFLALTTKTKLIFKGVNPEKFDCNSEDDPLLINKVKQIASDLGVAL